jgi:hypothetical protein
MEAVMSSHRSALRSWLGSWHVSAALALGVLAACAPAREPAPSGELPPSHPPLVGELGETARGASSLPPCPEDETGRIYLGLRPSCVGCHGVGTNLAFFATEASFRALLVGNPAYVTPGDAAGSVLVKLLRGTNVGAFRQMPTAGAAYADLPSTQQPVSMAEVERWIDGLGAVVRSTTPDPDAPTVRRLTAEEIVASLYDQLGLSEADFLGQPSSNFSSPTVTFRGDLPVWSPDQAPGPHYPADRLATETRWRGLGGPGWLSGAQRTRVVTPSLMQTLRQLSYAWCRMAVRKANNSVIFQRARPTDTTAMAAAAIRADLASMHLRMLGDPASPAELDALLSDVFQPAETAGGPQVAWTAACASFVQDARWLAW